MARKSGSRDSCYLEIEQKKKGQMDESQELEVWWQKVERPALKVGVKDRIALLTSEGANRSGQTPGEGCSNTERIVNCGYLWRG